MPAPAPVDLVRWPAGFGRRFIVFVDVEEEFDWRLPVDRHNRSVAAMRAFPRAHARFAEHGVGLACMVTHPVASDPASIEMLRALAADGRSSIGAQLHPWVTPPYGPPAAFDSYAGNLPPAQEAAKLDALTNLLRESFGHQPLSYRAGRYGIGPATAALIASRGYRVDASVRARYDYRPQGGPDFTAVGSEPFRMGPLIEVPLTTVFTGRLRRHGASLSRLLHRFPRAQGGLSRARLLERIALTPEDMPIDSAEEAVRIAVGEGQLQLLSLSFHSPSLEPGHTPYVRQADDLALFWTWWQRMFALFERLDVTPIGMDELIAAVAPAV